MNTCSAPRAVEQGEAPAEQKFLYYLVLKTTMGRKPTRRSRGARKYLRGNIKHTQDLGSLGPSTGIKKAFGGTVTEKTWVISVEATYSLANFTAVANAGPITVYLAHSDYTLAEVEEYIEASLTGSWDVSDLRTAEQRGRGRRIKKVGTFYPESGHLAADILRISKRPIKTKLNFMLNTGKTVAAIYYNSGIAGLTVTTPDAEMLGYANLWPQ